MEQLGIVNAPLVGHSMGGTVSLSVAIRYPQRVSKVVVVGSPIVGSSLAVPLKLAGYRHCIYAFQYDGAFRLAVRAASPLICRDERFTDMMDRDLSRTTLESFLLSIASLRRTDLRPMLGQIKVPAMGMYGDRDVIVHPRQWEPMKAGIEHAEIERFPVRGHFIDAWDRRLLGTAQASSGWERAVPAPQLSHRCRQPFCNLMNTKRSIFIQTAWGGLFSCRWKR
jgi:pimeloyl-ACP methyl ester carboxylesterase